MTVITIVIEYFRIHCWNQFLKKVYDESVAIINDKQFAKTILSNKKQFYQKIVGFYTSVIGFSKDLDSTVFFPNNTNLKSMKKILEYEFAFHNYPKDFFEKSFEILLINNEKHRILFEEYYEEIIKNTSTLISSVLDKSVSDKNIQFKLIINDHLKSIFPKVIESTLIPNDTYAKLKSLSVSDDTDALVMALNIRYQFYSLLKESISLSTVMGYKFIKQHKYESISIEAFSGSINSNLPNYCSLFYDIEKYFGSCGNFFTTDLSDYNIVIANPPFVLDIIDRLAVRTLQLFETNDKLTVLINIPDWRSNKSIKLDANDNKIVDINTAKANNSDEQYYSYETLRSSKYFVKMFVLGTCNYYNYFKNMTTKININTLIIILTNDTLNTGAQMINYLTNYYTLNANNVKLLC